MFSRLSVILVQKKNFKTKQKLYFVIKTNLNIINKMYKFKLNEYDLLNSINLLKAF